MHVRISLGACTGPTTAITCRQLGGLHCCHCRRHPVQVITLQSSTCTFEEPDTVIMPNTARSCNSNDRNIAATVTVTDSCSGQPIILYKQSSSTDAVDGVNYINVVYTAAASTAEGRCGTCLQTRRFHMYTTCRASAMAGPASNDQAEAAATIDPKTSLASYTPFPGTRWGWNAQLLQLRTADSITSMAEGRGATVWAGTGKADTTQGVNVRRVSLKYVAGAGYIGAFVAAQNVRPSGPVGTRCACDAFVKVYTRFFTYSQTPVASCSAQDGAWNCPITYTGIPATEGFSCNGGRVWCAVHFTVDYVE